MKTPSYDDLCIAAEWLACYDADEDADEDDGVVDEAEVACHRVSAWLLRQAEAAEFREACREAGVSVVQGRKAMRLARKSAQE